MRNRFVLYLRGLILSVLIAIAPSSWLVAQNAPTHSGLDLAGIDKAANPCEDFYKYACGSWMKQHPIPADESRWGQFSLLDERNLAILRQTAEDSAKHQDRSSLDQQVGAFYGSCADEGQIQTRGSAPVKPELDRIANLDSREDVLDEVARLHKMQVGVFFDFSSGPDPHNSSMMKADLSQGGLGLPERDFYLRTDERSVSVRNKYVVHIANMFKLIGVSDSVAKQKADAIMKLETKLAKASLDITSMRDPQQRTHDYKRTDLPKLTSNIDFDRYFAAVGSPAFANLNVEEPDFFKSLDQVATSLSIEDARDYLTWHFLHASAPVLSSEFVKENFSFYSQTLRGTKEQRPRWKRCVAMTDEELGEALGQKFVEQTFGQEGKQRTLELVSQIEREMAVDISSLTWMSADTKKQALIKLKAVTNKIGYPDKWRDYSSIHVKADDYFGNFYRANEFESKRQRDRIGKPTDRSEWEMTPPTVNAYYDPTQNNINFPAGILQNPFYSNTASDATNYGAIGVVVGHELTHGFDDEGRQFDADGNLRDWWQKSDADQFEKLAQCFVNEYGGFSPVPGVELNGKLTLGENSADNGGLRLSYFALINELQKEGKSPKDTADGYTQAQQFFLGFAQVWCQNTRDETKRLAAQTDPHSPGEFRTNGAVKNMIEFSQAFGCKEGDKMYASKPCLVW